MVNVFQIAKRAIGDLVDSKIDYTRIKLVMYAFKGMLTTEEYYYCRLLAYCRIKRYRNKARQLYGQIIAELQAKNNQELFIQFAGDLISYELTLLDGTEISKLIELLVSSELLQNNRHLCLRSMESREVRSLPKTIPYQVSDEYLSNILTRVQELLKNGEPTDVSVLTVQNNSGDQVVVLPKKKFDKRLYVYSMTAFGETKFALLNRDASSVSVGNALTRDNLLLNKSVSSCSIDNQCITYFSNENEDEIAILLKFGK